MWFIFALWASVLATLVVVYHPMPITEERKS